MGRQPCCDKLGVKKGPWTADEDKKLMNFILNNGHCCWRAVPKLAGLLRCGKSCRLRWTNYLRPDLKRGLLSEAEEQIVIDLHARLGNRWSKIAAKLPGRTDNEIKNHWNTHIKKKLIKMGIDPVTHKPLNLEAASSNTSESVAETESKSDFQSLPGVGDHHQGHVNNSSDNTSPAEASTVNTNGGEPSVNCLFEGNIIPIEGQWQFTSSEEDYTSVLDTITWEQNYEWLFDDYQDFGVGDLGTESLMFDNWNTQ